MIEYHCPDCDYKILDLEIRAVPAALIGGAVWAIKWKNRRAY
ncbi:Uncharacterised protein [Streptococcus pneumoniae]|nr:Uncharacterised protein [Streptococcus pneumoniae]